MYIRECGCVVFVKYRKLVNSLRRQIHGLSTGFIVVLTEMKQKDPQTKHDWLVHIAAILEHYNGTDTISQKSLESKENPCFAATIQCLRLQVLSTPRLLPIDD
jgi:translation elongation factor EF-Ts